ncbi:glucan endo-1,3-beta-glucosidase 12 [Dorcoceras hygrometricum]|uniref:Glucan endo-1,3-beta-glucosidase 12 n=1 Tax=Dorcoceras hygrometricum TaxID=472368 RepID=A0A2Z6ZX55_9LAMI|nr:glucan endo-1,3-beta-glucosidase 12 [Dorcoceras hygrometricum]
MDAVDGFAMMRERARTATPNRRSIGAAVPHERRVIFCPYAQRCCAAGSTMVDRLRKQCAIVRRRPRASCRTSPPALHRECCAIELFVAPPAALRLCDADRAWRTTLEVAGRAGAT